MKLSGLGVQTQSRLTAFKVYIPLLRHGREPGRYHPLLVWVHQLEIIVSDQSARDLADLDVCKVLSRAHVITLPPLLSNRYEPGTEENSLEACLTCTIYLCSPLAFGPSHLVGLNFLASGPNAFSLPWMTQGWMHRVVFTDVSTESTTSQTVLGGSIPLRRNVGHRRLGHLSAPLEAAGMKD